MKLENNIILITGGSSGIGLELAKQLVQLGNKVIVTGRDLQKLETVKSQFPEIRTFKSDVTRLDEIKALYERVTQEFPGLNVLINNAGIGKTLNLRDQHDENALVLELQTNLQAPIQMTNKFLPQLLKQKHSAIVNITSALAFSPLPIVPIYSAAKAGLRSYTLSLRMQLRGTCVKVFEVAPPTTQTDMLHGFAAGDLKEVSAMKASDMVACTLRKIKEDQLEICPGQAAQLRLMSRLAPGYVLRLMSKTLDRQTSLKSQ